MNQNARTSRPWALSFRAGLAWLIGSWLLALAAPAAAQNVAWQLGRPTWKNEREHSPNVRIDDIQVHQRGGFVRVTALDDGGCAPGAGTPGTARQSQTFTFQWFFDRDITVLRKGDELNIRLAAQGSENRCLQVNPFIEVKGWGHEFEFIRSGRYYALPHLLGNPAGHDGGERKVRVWRDGPVQGKDGINWVDINVWGFAGNRPFDLHIKYPYTPVSGGTVGIAPTPTPVPPMPPQPQPAVSFAVQGGTDLPGSDYRSFWQSQDFWSVCQEACRADGQCHSFTYVRAGVQGPQAKCWLKNSVPAPVPNSNCCVSGAKVTGLYRRR